MEKLAGLSGIALHAGTKRSFSLMHIYIWLTATSERMTLTVSLRILSISSVFDTISLYRFMRFSCCSFSEKTVVSSFLNSRMQTNSAAVISTKLSIFGSAMLPPYFSS